MKRKFIAFAMVVVLCLGILSGCKKDTTTDGDVGQKPGEKETVEGKPAKEQVFSFSTLDEPTGLNPIINTTAPDNSVHRFFLETLVRYVTNEDGLAVVEPGIAESWEVSDDGLVWTFHLREDAIWDDDVPVTAHDFVFTYRMMATPEIGSTNAHLFDDVILNYTEAHYDEGKKPEDIGVKAIDDYTLEFTLIKPCAYFPELLNGARPIRQDKYEEWGEEYGSSLDKVIGNGPFKIETWEPNVKMVFVKNEKYWDVENVKLEKVNRYIVEEPAASIQAFLTGQTDVVSTNDPDWQQEIEATGDYDVIVTSSDAPEFYGFNCANKYFKNPKIRLAFSLSLDREKYNEELNHGKTIPLYSLIPSIMNCGDELYVDLIDGNPDIVKELQEKYPDPKELLIEGLKEEGLDPDPSKMEVRYATRGTSEYSKKAAEWLLQEWREKLGVEIIIDMMEWNIMWDKVDEGDYDIMTGGWGPYYNDPNALLEIYHPINGYFNSKKSGWTGPDADRYRELLEEAAMSSDNKERAQLFYEAEKLLVGTGVIAPTYLGTYTTYKAKHVKGYYESPHAATDFNRIYIE